jgi:hypothetical protein
VASVANRLPRCAPSGCALENKPGRSPVAATLIAGPHGCEP